MNRRIKIGVAAALVAAGGAVAIAAPAQAATYEESSAMAQVLASQDPSAGARDAEEPRAVAGVARAMVVGFKAATAPQAAANVARLASVLGFTADTPQQSPQVEAAYFDR